MEPNQCCQLLSLKERSVVTLNTGIPTMYLCIYQPWDTDWANQNWCSNHFSLCFTSFLFGSTEFHNQIWYFFHWNQIRTAVLSILIASSLYSALGLPFILGTDTNADWPTHTRHTLVGLLIMHTEARAMKMIHLGPVANRKKKTKKSSAEDPMLLACLQPLFKQQSF